MTTGLSAPAADLVRTVTGHRSIRKYRPEPVDESIVQALIACAQAEARNLLLYADHCPKATAAIKSALHAAELRGNEA